MNETVDDLSLNYLSLKKIINNEIIGMGSACIVELMQQYIFLTVQHVVKNDEPWSLDIKYVPGEGVTEKPIQGLHYLGAILNPENIKEKPEETLANADLIDIAFKNITNEIDEYKAYFQVIDDRTYPGKIVKEIEKKRLKTDFSIEPKEGEYYYFAGLTQGQILPIPQKDYGFIQTETKERLTFKKTVGLFYVFDVTSGHRGDEHYEGCSGSPILDADGNIVSLVTHRNPCTTEVCGINLVEIGNIIKPLIELGII